MDGVEIRRIKKSTAMKMIHQGTVDIEEVKRIGNAWYAVIFNWATCNYYEYKTCAPR